MDTILVVNAGSSSVKFQVFASANASGAKTVSAVAESSLNARNSDKIAWPVRSTNQVSKAAPGNLRIGIFDGRKNAPNARFN